MTIPRVLIADDHPLIRVGLRQALDGVDARLDIREVASVEGLSNVLQEDTQFDMLLLDLTMPGSRGLSGFTYVRCCRPEIPIAIVSTADSPKLIRLCKQIGAKGFIPKSTDMPTLLDALDTLMCGSSWFPNCIAPAELVDGELRELATRFTKLTPRQMSTLVLMCRGCLNEEIGQDFGISVATVIAHVSNILKKLEVNNRTQAVVAYHQISKIRRLVRELRT